MAGFRGKVLLALVLVLATSSSAQAWFWGWRSWGYSYYSPAYYAPAYYYAPVYPVCTAFIPMALPQAAPPSQAAATPLPAPVAKKITEAKQPSAPTTKEPATGDLMKKGPTVTE